MNLTLQLKNAITKVSHWEYWPLKLVYLPILAFWLFYALRARKLFFFTAVNPGIHTGGFFGCSKMDILNKIPTSFIPNTAFVPKNTTWSKVKEILQHQEITFPCIIKPDIGERGLLVQKITSIEALRVIFDTIHFDLIIQNYSPYEEELALLCYRIPDSSITNISSLCRKEFLMVHGDGKSTIRQLIHNHPRALTQLNRLEKSGRIDLDEVIPTGENKIIEPIGNHIRGTKFLDIQKLRNPQLLKTFIDILDNMEDVHYGRFDLMTSSVENASIGRDIHIFEFNGTASEPAHCYDPQNSLWSFYKSMGHHWSVMYRIYKTQKAKGYEAMSFGTYYKAYRDYKKLIHSYS